MVKSILRESHQRLGLFAGESTDHQHRPSDIKRIMLTYVLIVLSLSLAGVAGLQLVYMFYLDRLDRERKKRLHELELRCRELSRLLGEARQQLAERDDMLASMHLEFENDQEMWADLLDDR